MLLTKYFILVPWASFHTKMNAKKLKLSYGWNILPITLYITCFQNHARISQHYDCVKDSCCNATKASEKWQQRAIKIKVPVDARITISNLFRSEYFGKGKRRAHFLYAMCSSSVCKNTWKYVCFQQIHKGTPKLNYLCTNSYQLFH